MTRPLARSAAWILALVFSFGLSACGGDEHKNMDHSKPETYK
jgi:hypothetical protein